MKLTTKHIFMLLKITKKAGLFDSVKSLLLKNMEKAKGSEENVRKAQAELGMDLILTIVSNIDKSQDEVFELVGDILDIKPQDVAEQDPVKTMEVIQGIIESEGFKSFLKFFMK